MSRCFPGAGLAQKRLWAVVVVAGSYESGGAVAARRSACFGDQPVKARAASRMSASV